jgi:hypothetical protein
MRSDEETGGATAQALFDCGRLCIQLRFHRFQAAYLLAGKSHVLRAIAIASRIERLSQRLELTAVARGVLGALRKTGDEFLGVYTSEWFTETLTSRYERFTEETVFPESTYNNGEEDRRNACDLHLVLEIEAAEWLREALLDGCDRGSRLAFELGELVEQAIHPRDVQRHFFKFHSIDGCWHDGYRGGYFYLDDRAPGDVPPPEGWPRRIRAMLKDLGLNEGTPGITPLRLPASVEARRKAVGVTTRTIRDRLAAAEGRRSSEPESSADAGPHGQAGEPRASGYHGNKNPEADRERTGRETGWRTAGHLDIEINENERMLRRGDRTELELKGTLNWNIALAFLDAGDRYLSVREQRDIWDQSNRADNIEEETITMSIVRLNKSLVRLDVRIVANSGRRRMEELPAKK